jgi:hypothetical protein
LSQFFFFYVNAFLFNLEAKGIYKEDLYKSLSEVWSIGLTDKIRYGVAMFIRRDSKNVIVMYPGVEGYKSFPTCVTKQQMLENFYELHLAFIRYFRDYCQSKAKGVNLLNIDRKFADYVKIVFIPVLNEDLTPYIHYSPNLGSFSVRRVYTSESRYFSIRRVYTSESRTFAIKKVYTSTVKDEFAYRLSQGLVPPSGGEAGMSALHTHLPDTLNKYSLYYSSTKLLPVTRSGVNTSKIFTRKITYKHSSTLFTSSPPVAFPPSPFCPLRGRCTVPGAFLINHSL